ncbi:S-layer homology domain-containing protein [Propionibacterium freudenreichii]|uniref:S-layer homology domain-containing protein n=1 Tax=Propionibacterium freudenreichii TaxID=1744 RepID=UPI0022FD4413|nr:S-layer homology domain-containing protein [Propionibacterium freudenreichii]
MTSAGLKEKGITTGWPDGTFRPVTPVAREAMAAFLYRQAGSPDVTLPKDPSFTDVPADNMFYKEIEWMQQKGIAGGWDDGTYRPLNDTNRDAMAAFIHRAVNQGIITLK